VGVTPAGQLEDRWKCSDRVKINTVKGKVKAKHLSTARWPYGWCSSPFIKPVAGNECKHNSVIWEEGSPDLPHYCHYMPSS